VIAFVVASGSRPSRPDHEGITVDGVDARRCGDVGGRVAAGEAVVVLVTVAEPLEADTSSPLCRRTKVRRMSQARIQVTQ